MRRWIITGFIITLGCTIDSTRAFYNRGEVVRYHPQMPLYTFTSWGDRQYYVRFITVGGYDTMRVWTQEDWHEHQIVKLR